MHGFFLFMHIKCIDRSYFKGMILPYCVYVLQSQRDLLLYHGFTTNLEQRIRNHNAGKTISTSKRRPLKIIYCEFFLSKKDAIRRESYFKTTQGKRMLKLIIRETLLKVNYPR
jgi:putative endonuclease